MKGKVYLIGCGPGDPDLLTLKAANILKKADLVMFDRLVNRKILELVPNEAKQIYVGKMPGHCSLTQYEINEIMVEGALKGENVVRLKGGDPFVFGRGGEEALFLKENNVPFEIIPGISSAIAVPAYAGIPITYRSISSSFHVFTGSGAEGSVDHLNWKVISQLDGTLIFLMGMKNIEFITKNLIKYGKNAASPAAVIMDGTTSDQKTVTGNISNIVKKVWQSDIKNPSILVIGDVVNLKNELDWYETKKLFGRRIVITGPDNSNALVNSNYASVLLNEGAEIIYCPILKITYAMNEIFKLFDDIHSYDILLFTSKNSVESFKRAAREKKIDFRALNNIKIAAIGSATKRKLDEISLYPNIMPGEFTAKALADLVEKVCNPSKNIAVITSDIGGTSLIYDLEHRGFKANKIIAYYNCPNYKVKDWFNGEWQRKIDAIIYTSPSAFRYMNEVIGQDFVQVYNPTIIAAIGPATKKAIEAAGYEVNVMSEEHVLDAALKNILDNF